MPATDPEQAPDRYARWIDEVRAGARLRDYASRDEVAERLRRNNPRLGSRSGRRSSRCTGRTNAPTDVSNSPAIPTHKIINPMLYRRATR